MGSQFNDEMSIQELIFILQWLRAEANNFYGRNVKLGCVIGEHPDSRYNNSEVKEEHKRMTARIAVLEKMIDAKCTNLTKAATKAATKEAQARYEIVPALEALENITFWRAVRSADA